MATRQQNAREFVKTWSSSNKGREDADRQTFWNDLLQRVYGINDYYNYITYEKDVQVKAGGKVTTRRIDGYIPSTKVMIEMKGKIIKDLTKPLKQSGWGGDLTPFEQAKRYANFLPNSEQPRWILVSNFNEIDIHDMEKPLATPTVIKLSDLPQKVKLLEFIVNASQQKVMDEKKLSVDAGNLVAKIYHELTNAYAEGRGVDVNSPEIQRSLNMLIVRLVFLLYADDSNLFGKDNIFQAFIERREPRDIRRNLSDLFKVLDQPESERDPYLDDEFNQFDYVNGGMFSDENIIIPQFTDELKRLIVEEAGAGFDWSGISPTIFGAVFESTLNPETRRSGGMHYTSIENIHKVIDPLFLNDLHDEFDKIQNMGNNNQRIIKAREFREKLGKLKFFDPACGSGNFLTETYLSLRKMENECLRIITGDQGTLAITDDSDPKVKIQNLYGIEINDFAVSVARTAMWIAESQMWEQTKDITFANKDFLPLDSNNSIYEGNALRIDWNDIVKPYELNYIMGNPPFIGKKEQTSSQKEDLKTIFDNQRIGTLDYVTGWYKKAADYIKGHSIRVAFVSTNSITQGEQVVRLWTLLKNYDLTINFAYRTFVWNNEAKHKAHVHVVIIGFSNKDFATDTKDIFTDNDSIITATTINPYLLDAPTVLIKSRSKPISSVEPMNYGSMPIDDGNLILSSEEKDHLLSNDPLLKKFIRPYYGGREILHSTPRYCLWLVGITPADLRSHPSIIKYIDATREFREASHRPGTLKAAERPAEFGEIRQPKSGQVIVLPKVSSERRKYIPIEYMDSKNIINGSALMIQNANLYMFGVLNSVVHNAWMRVVAGRMKSDYQYSAKIVYNNFPWPEIDNRQKGAIVKTAQGIISARKDDPDATLAELYTPKNFENIEISLRQAHEANDKAVLKTYRLKPSATEPEIVQHLFKMYEELTRKDKRNHE
ncbi:DNA methyltransferase [Limosilactobacillus fermentum]|uniref:DNA methyltransferase n=1 Tax=Limosilactobacillus fermentum TaxID=1613 RepID=UPI00128CC5FF|nr:DNA methyltransferase [Limosilactobacillus fermentum]MCD5423915.1 N-6 DNA methylase [Limosilactobacillus fermentum]MPW02903.1 N-6 DNA methylase [Limosilactobacillus fermentum]